MAKQGIFISHISEEAELATLLKDQLNAEFPNDLNVFVSSDRTSVQAGAEWLQELKKALRDAPVVIVMCSRESVGKPWVNFEAGGGWIRDAPLVPVCHSGLSPADLPVPLKMLNGIEANDSSGLQKLHDVIAKVLDVKEREIDRSAYIASFRKMEDEYRKKMNDTDRIVRPAVLCATTQQYNDPAYGFDKDLETLRRNFGDSVFPERNLTSRGLHDLLRDKPYCIVHLVTAVERRTGDLIFSEVDCKTGDPVDSRPDRLSPRSFADQLRRTGNTDLVFLATCWGLFLGVEVARVTNMVATHISIYDRQVIKWAEYFYHYLGSGDSLFDAADATISQIPQVPLRLIPHHNFAIKTE